MRCSVFEKYEIIQLSNNRAYLLNNRCIGWTPLNPRSIAGPSVIRWVVLTGCVTKHPRHKRVWNKLPVKIRPPLLTWH